MKNLSMKEWIAVGAGVAFVAYMFFGNAIYNLFVSETGSAQTSAVNVAANSMNTNPNNAEVGDANPATTSQGGVQIQDVTVGTGAEVKTGTKVSVNYILRLSDGTVIQDSKQVNNGQPFTFTLGVDRLIPGWEIGIAGMKTGGKRLILVPPELGYGAQAAGPIPANSTLIFEIEVVSAQ